MRAQVLYDLDRMNIPIKIIGMMKDSMGNAVQAFAYESDHVPVAGDVIAHDDVKYVVNRRFWAARSRLGVNAGFDHDLFGWFLSVNTRPKDVDQTGGNNKCSHTFKIC